MKTRSNHRLIHVLYVSDGGRRVRALCEALKNRGHRVSSAGSLREILLSSECHVLVLDVAQRDEEHALMLLEEIQHAGTELPIVMVSGQPSYELCQSAADFGVAALIQRAFAPTALANAVEHCADDQGPDAPARIEHSRRYSSKAQGADDALRGISNYLEEALLAPAHITRILVASAEIIDNIKRHAYSTHGEFLVEAQVQRSRLWLCISDSGSGMNQSSARLDAMAPALPTRQRPKAISKGAPQVFGGLSRAARLADRFEADSNQDGSRLQLEFELSPVACSARELPELSSLQPQPMRALLAAIEADRFPMPELSPVLALTVQRLLGHDAVQRHGLKKV